MRKQPASKCFLVFFLSVFTTGTKKTRYGCEDGSEAQLHGGEKQHMVLLQHKQCKQTKRDAGGVCVCVGEERQLLLQEIQMGCSLACI